MKILLSLLVSFSVLALSPGETAPDFSLRSHDGKTYKLSDFKGKTIILEWLNHGCPFVRKHYDAKNMQATQKINIDKNTIWLSIISSAKGRQGHSTPEQAKADKEKYGSMAHHILIDESGDVGKMYNAVTTPHMYIINPNFRLSYIGAIDSIPSSNPADIQKAKNYVNMAVEDVLAGRTPKIAKTKPYGCSVKY